MTELTEKTPTKRGRKPGRTHTARIDFRLPPDAREKIELAAYHSGMSLSDFAASTLLERAENVLEKQRVTVLSNRQWEYFANLLQNPPAPTEDLQRLMSAGEKHGRTDSDGVTHFGSRVSESLNDEDRHDPH